MKSIYNSQQLAELKDRIHSIQPSDTAQWGKMTVYQMLKHCTLSEEMFQGAASYPRLFIGKLFGRMALNGILKNEAPLKQNQPTHPALRITGSGDVVTERNKWQWLMEQYAGNEYPAFVHPFFGKMTKEEIGKYIYKHTDHHLRQFGR